MLALYFFAFLRDESDFAVGFFSADILLLTAFLMAAFGDGLEVEPDRRSSTAAPAASGIVLRPSMPSRRVHYRPPSFSIQFD